jgi:RNase adaptor protein for sRNA GlmZ degradation
MKGIHFDQRVRAPDHVLFRELDGEAVMLNLEDESYYGLDAVGTRMWTALQTAETIGDAHAQLLAVYDVDAGQLREDLIELLETLRERGLVIISDTAG